MTHPELPAEQAYVDRAYDQLDRMRSTVARTQEAMATEWAALNMEAWVKRRMRTFEDAERGLVFGRLTLDGTPRPLYVGRRWVHDDEHESLVVNWQAPAARPFYTATPSDPQRVTQRRRFRTEGRRLVDISDEALDGSGVEGATVSDFLLEELDRRREGRMRDIVATIQKEQDEAIRSPALGVTVVRGGPGTGKTAVALHRAAYLLYSDRQRFAGGGVLVVGPSPVFVSYISRVLPSLGEDDVTLASLGSLVVGVEDAAAARGVVHHRVALDQRAGRTRRGDLVPGRLDLGGLPLDDLQPGVDAVDVPLLRGDLLGGARVSYRCQPRHSPSCTPHASPCGCGGG